MRLSIWPTPQQPWADVLDVVRHADATGWHAVYFWDHFMGDGADFGPEDAPSLESTAVLSALGALTSSLRLGPLVLGNTYRHPAVVANWASTVDHITDGRLVLGIGAGWQANEHDQYGIELPPPGERRRRLDEAATVIRSLLTQERSTFDGTYYQLTDAVCEPKPVQAQVPIMIGAKGDLMLRVVARHADIWNMWGLPDWFGRRSAELDRACVELERDPGDIERSTQALVFLTDDPDEGRRLVDAVSPRAAIAGPPARFAEVVAQWRDVGVDEVIVPDATLGRGERRRESLDALREAVAGI